MMCASQTSLCLYRTIVARVTCTSCSCQCAGRANASSMCCALCECPSWVGMRRACAVHVSCAMPVPCPHPCATGVVSVPVLCHFGTSALPANMRQRRGATAFGCRGVAVLSIIPTPPGRTQVDTAVGVANVPNVGAQPVTVERCCAT